MDNTNLTIALGMVSLVTSVILLVNWAANKQVPGLLRITFGHMITCVGILLIGYQGSLPAIISILIANSLIMGGQVPVLSGYAHFWNQETTKLPLFCLVWFLATVTGFYYFTFIDESIVWRVRLFSTMMTIVSVSAVFILARGVSIERKLRPIMAINTNFGAYFLITIAVFNAVAQFMFMFLRADQPITSPEEATTAALVAAIVNVVVFALAIMVMTMEELKVEYQENAIFDPITTILNERTFIEVCNRVLGVALRYTKPVSMLTLEITNFDDIVKQHGQKVGNAILRHFALMATDRRRNEDVLARSSYKQFRMLLPGVDEAGSQVVIKKIEDAVLGEEYVYRGHALKLEFIICAVTKREEDLHLQQMLQEGEVELFRIKNPPASPV
ncbi:MAG: GGDEF domain-containing protein [Pseudohongiella sp.]|nr:MAG: GGDEF domain-containing protein [Pseudohongiella sp.]